MQDIHVQPSSQHSVIGCPLNIGLGPEFFDLGPLFSFLSKGVNGGEVTLVSNFKIERKAHGH